MVLSNKKLKQKARATLAGSLIASVDRGHPLDPDCGDPSSQTRSLKQLLDSATQKPRLSKREKRRKALGSSGSPETAVGGIARDEEEEEKKEAGSGVEKIDEKRKKEKKKKRKRGGDGADNEIESGATPGEKDSAKKVKKKKKKKKSNKSKAENGEQHPGSETGNGGIEEQEVVQAASISHSQENGDVSTKVYVGGIPFYSTEDDIRSFFESCGTITEVDCMMFPESGKFRGISILSFKY